MEQASVDVDGNFVGIGVGTVDGDRLSDGLVFDGLADGIEVVGNADALGLTIAEGIGGGTGVVGIAVGLG